jgi:hydroxypyruvate isomerase
MVNLSVCIDTFFLNSDYEKKIIKVGSLGFKNYEMWFLDKSFNGSELIDEKRDLDRILELNEKHNLKLTSFIFNHPWGAVQASLIDKKDRNKILEGIEEVIPYAKKLGCNSLVGTSGMEVEGLPKSRAIENMTETLSQLMKICEKENITILIEPWNTTVDHPGYFLNDPFVALNIIKEVNHKNCKILYDIYHMQIMKGNIISFIRDNIDYIGHFHIAGVPGRHEIANNELNYNFIVHDIYNLGYSGYVGIEYFPSIDDERSLIQTSKTLK